MQGTLVIPCYNEARNLPLLIARCREVFVGTQMIALLVDNGSTDNSADVLRNEVRPGDPIRTVRVEKNQGYGFGILAGLAAADTPVLGWTHADMQTDVADALTAFAMFTQSAAPERLFVKGRRVRRPLGDAVFSYGMSAFETLLMGRVLYEINAQPTMFHRAFYEALSEPPHDFSLDLFFYVKAKAARCTVKRIPVTFGARAFGESSWNINWQAKLRFIRRTLDYSFELRRRLSRSPSRSGEAGR